MNDYLSTPYTVQAKHVNATSKK